MSGSKVAGEKLFVGVRIGILSDFSPATYASAGLTWTCSSHRRFSVPPSHHLNLHLPGEGLLHPGSLFDGAGSHQPWALCPGYGSALQIQCVFAVILFLQ